uniref:Uncharacterized protein n=1 Tax=Aegilops tauschii subsp. strangulata TaxID=200361 RepID=A0A453PWF4_AEGTS
YDNWFSSEYPLYFGFVPQLSKLSLIKTGIRSDKTLELSQLLANVPSIGDLRLDFGSEKVPISHLYHTCPFSLYDGYMYQQ